ncbi:hypothetical protein VM1G_11773 [Cytospora mali]|uniref:Uncharacterized protein n=1 Tax=Cytospora mali TaxID=578113 RepID=A0A194W5U4_CYTMA|nr:hypothetical protein VM1G_11773 [Valsa mali]
MSERIPWKCSESLAEDDNSGTDDVSSHQGNRALGGPEDKVWQDFSDGPTAAVLVRTPCRRIKELLASLNYLAQGRILDREGDARQSNAQGF